MIYISLKWLSGKPLIFHHDVRVLEAGEVCPAKYKYPFVFWTYFHNNKWRDFLFSFFPKEILTVLTRKEKEAKIVPDPDIDTYMKVFLVADIYLSFFWSHEVSVFIHPWAILLEILIECSVHLALEVYAHR